MSFLLLNTEVAQFNTVIDRRILETFKDYCVQYGAIPQRLFLTDPTLSAHTAIVIVDTSQRESIDTKRPIIYLAFYHPTILAPLHIQTCGEFSQVYSAHSVDATWGEFLIDHEPEFEEDYPTDYFERLLAAYPAFSRIEQSMVSERIRFFTLPIQSLSVS